MKPSPTLPGFSRVVFLSHVNEPGMPLFPGDPAFELRSAATVAADGYCLQELRKGHRLGSGRVPATDSRRVEWRC